MPFKEVVAAGSLDSEALSLLRSVLDEISPSGTEEEARRDIASRLVALYQMGVLDRDHLIKKMADSSGSRLAS